MIKKSILEVNHLSAQAKGKTIFHPVSFNVVPNTVTGILGPSGIGKSTLLKCMNRLTDLQPHIKVTGSLFYRGKNIYSKQIKTETLREKVGMVFQAPVIFPGSIAKNVLFGIRQLKPEKKKEFPVILESALKEASLWDEVKDRLETSAEVLSVGQKQRLSIARTLTLKPDVLLLDEPTSALDPRSTESIEELFIKLKKEHTLVLVTHDTGQAERIGDTLVEMTWKEGAGAIKAIRSNHLTQIRLPSGKEPAFSL